MHGVSVFTRPVLHVASQTIAAVADDEVWIEPALDLRAGWRRAGVRRLTGRQNSRAYEQTKAPEKIG